MNYIELNRALLDRSRQMEFSGYDPFDGLNSTLFRFMPGVKQGVLGLAWLQLHKRLPLNARPFVGIPRTRSAKGTALFVLGLKQDFLRTQDQAYLQEAGSLVEWLLSDRCDAGIWKHSCWGYPFDWKARAFFVPKHAPNIISTVYAARAIAALAEMTGNEHVLAIAYEAAEFIATFLYDEFDGKPFFRYIPGESALVHNASLWGAAWVGLVGQRTRNEAFRQIATDVARHSIESQRPDGSWVYGNARHHQFVDGFHTGFNLEALTILAESLDSDEFAVPIARGLRYYKSTFIEPDGTARYYNYRRYPIDMHSVAQAIITLLKVGGKSSDLTLADLVIRRALETMYDPDEERFFYQRGQFVVNTVDYIRWTQAWSYYAIAYFNRFNLSNSISKD